MMNEGLDFTPKTPGDRLYEVQQVAIKRGLARSGSDLAAQLGLSPQVYSDYCTGKTRIPTSVARELHFRVGCSIDWLYDGEEHRNTNAFNCDLHGIRLNLQRGVGGRPRRNGDAACDASLVRSVD